MRNSRQVSSKWCMYILNPAVSSSLSLELIQNLAKSTAFHHVSAHKNNSQTKISIRSTAKGILHCLKVIIRIPLLEPNEH